jgi:Zn-dependent protease with chaperone function
VSSSFPARYFDGQSSRAHEVTATVDGAALRLRGEGVERDFTLAEARVSERLRHAPRLVTFADGSYCEVSDHAALDAVLADTGFADSWVVRWQNRWPYAVGALVATVAALVLAYLYVLPWGAEVAARHIPPELEARIGQEAVEWIDRRFFEPTRLPEERRARLVARFAEIAPKGARDYRIEFRRSRIGPNALALPGGTILMTDELVQLADSDDAVLGVLAHELGHIEHRHLLRRLITSTVTGAIATLLAGDASGIATAVPATLADLSYSRDMEREADDYAIATLRANGLPLAPLADLFEKMERAHEQRRAKDDGPDIRLDGYLSTHPDTAERVRKLRAAGR